MLWNLGRTLWTARPLPLPARFVVVGLCSLAVVAGFGIIFALVLGGVTTADHLTRLTVQGVPLHIIAALGGWLTFTAMGVSYRLLAMFMLAPELDGATSRATLYLGIAALAAAIIGGVTAICSYGGLGPALLAAALLGLGSLALYSRDILQLYRMRKRRLIELNSRMSGVALANLAASAILAIVLVGTGTLDRHLAALVFLVGFGWLTGLGLAQLYKVVAFLTWLECYGPALGKTQTPRVQDLVVEAHAAKWFWLYFLAVWSGVAALIAGETIAFRGAAAAMLVGTVGIVIQIVRSRCLADVAGTLRFPEGTCRPHLLISLTLQN